MGIVSIAGGIAKQACALVGFLALSTALLRCPAAALQKSIDDVRKVEISGNRIILDGDKGQILYRACGDLDSDGVRETVLGVIIYKGWFGGILVIRPSRSGPRLVAAEHTTTYGLHADVTDINGDRKLEVVLRAVSGDGHWYCSIYRLRNNRLVEIGWFFNTRFRDLDNDGVPELLSVEPVSAMYLGDHWLTIWKWNGKGYADVSRRFPHEYESVIRDLKRTIHELRYTSVYGIPDTPQSAPSTFADLYYYLGLAYEYRGLLDKARMQYAIAYRLDPTDERRANAFRRTSPGAIRNGLGDARQHNR